MNKLTAAIIALCLALVAANTASSVASPSSNKVSATGTCYNAATWKLDASRSGAKVGIVFTAAPLTPRSLWNVNTSWTGVNAVTNAALKADSKGRVTYKATQTTTAQTTVYVWLDNVSDVFTCIAAITI